MDVGVESGRVVVASLGLGVLLGSGGCMGSDAFLCASDVHCQRGATQGLCQPSGYCSFPDDTCASGQRYGQHASDALANQCVEPGVAEDGTTDAGGSTSITTSGSTTLTTSPMTTSTEGPVTTEPVDPDTSGGSSSGAMSDDDPGTTTMRDVVCWEDDFEDGVIDPSTWCVWSSPGFEVDEARGHLRVHLLPDEWGMGDGAGGAVLCDTFPLHGTAAAVELASVPQVSSFTEAFIDMGTPMLRLGLGIANDLVYAVTYDGMSYAGFAWQPYQPNVHRWLRIVGTDEGLVAETSPDGVTWAHVHTFEAELAGLSGSSGVGSWSEMVPLAPDSAQFEHFELCMLEG
jgi:hypothetical protein